MLQVCLNGARGPREHYNLPIRPETLAQAAADSVEAGATSIHLHPKTPDGADSLETRVVATAIRAVRAATPHVPVGVTTGAWTMPDPQDRITAIRNWTVLPDHASVNWHEPGAEEVAGALLERGVGVEAGIYSGTDASERFLRSPLRDRVRRVLAEVTDLTVRGSATTAPLLLERLRSVTTPILLHGEGAGAWAVLAIAAERGLDTRIGFEDTLQLPDGEIAESNAELVSAAMQRLSR